MAKQEQLSTYLNDHHAGASGAIDLANKAAVNNEGTPLGTFWSELLKALEADMSSLHRIMDLLQVQPAALKQAAGKAGEKLSRLKLHEKVTGDADLSRLLELETLSAGITGKSDLWQALTELAKTDTRLAGVELARLGTRAKAQLKSVQQQHRKVAATLFGS
ncbi:MAG: hypothetical protein M3137_10810 [Actinomycetota bacterium]|nr:hypothetical protein [Actinomycetota bacterium]